MSDQQQKQKLQHASKSWSKMGGFGREKYAATWQTQFIFWKIHVTTLKNPVQTSTWFAKHIRSGNRMIGPGSDINLDRHRVGQPWVDFLCELLTGTLTLTKYAPAGLIWFHFSVKYLYASDWTAAHWNADMAWVFSLGKYIFVCVVVHYMQGSPV